VIWSIPIVSHVDVLQDSNKLHHLESKPLEEVTVAVLGELAYEVSVQCTKTSRQMQNKVIGLLGDQSKNHNCLSVFPHDWSYEPCLMDPSTLIASTKEDGGLLHSRYESENTLNEICQEIDFLCNCAVGRQNYVSSFGFMGTMLDLKLLSGAPYSNSEVVEIQPQEGSRKPKRCKCIKNTEAISLNLVGKTELNNIMEMGDQALVGHFPGKRMSSKELKNWIKMNFGPVVGASSHTFIMVRMVGFVF
jgi:hypothetical protein